MDPTQETFLKTHHVFTGEELEKMWEKVALTASESTAKQLIKAISEENLFPFINAEEACKLLRSTAQSLNKAERKGTLRRYWFYGKKLYKRVELIRLVEECEKGAV